VWEKLSKSHTLIERWSARYSWVSRAQSFDVAELQVRRKSLESGDLPMRERQTTIAAAIQQTLGRRLKNMTPEEIAKLKPNEVANLLRVSSLVEFRARKAEEKAEQTAGNEAPRHHHRWHSLDEIEEALWLFDGLRTMAAKALGMGASALSARIAKSERLQLTLTAIEQASLDLAESAIHTGLRKGNQETAKFYLRCKGRIRGYVEQQDINANFSGLPPVPPPTLIVNFLDTPVPARIIYGERLPNTGTNELPGTAPEGIPTDSASGVDAEPDRPV
jgi:hypothetical protein